MVRKETAVSDSRSEASGEVTDPLPGEVIH